MISLNVKYDTISYSWKMICSPFQRINNLSFPTFESHLAYIGGRATLPLRLLIKQRQLRLNCALANSKSRMRRDPSLFQSVSNIHHAVRATNTTQAAQSVPGRATGPSFASKICAFPFKILDNLRYLRRASPSRAAFVAVQRVRAGERSDIVRAVSVNGASSSGAAAQSQDVAFTFGVLL